MSDDAEIEVLTDVIITKYKTAGDICNAVLLEVIKSCVAGANVLDLCQAGDDLIVAKTEKVYTKKVKVKNAEGKEENKMLKKGVAFPTCVSVNGIVAHYSPIAEDLPLKVLADRDVCKIELGVHIDGYIATVAHTIVVGATAAAPVTGALADTLKGAYTAGEAAIRMLKIGTTNSSITEMVGKVCSEFECTPVEGMLSHVQARNKVKVADKSIVQNPNEQQRNHERFDIAENMAIGFSVYASGGNGKVKDTEERTTVFQKTELKYQLRLQSARSTFGEISKRFNLMPFSLRSLSNQKMARMGIHECNKHGIVEGYKVQSVKEAGATVSHFKFSALVTAKGIIKLTGLPLEAEVVSDKVVKDEEIITLLKESISRKSKGNKKRKKELESKKKQEEEEAEHQD